MFFSRRWRKQPQYPVGIDWSNPLTRNLVAAYPFINGLIGYDAVTRKYALTGYGGIRAIPFSLGPEIAGGQAPGAQINGTTQYLDGVAPASVYPLAIACFVRGVGDVIGRTSSG